MNGKTLGLTLGVLLAGTTGIGVAAAPSKDHQTCVGRAESKQLDFWLGDWVVSYPGAPKASTSRVTHELDDCVIVENWEGGKGHSGKNIFAYSADDGSWHGLFADNEGRVHVFEGKVHGPSAEFVGPSRSPKGESVLNRIRIERLDDGKVRQSWDKSSDQGATWKSEFSGEYSRAGA